MKPVINPARRALWKWALYDAGLAAFNTLIVTFVFAVYVTHTLAPAMGGTIASGTAAWGAMLSLSGIAVLCLAPLAAFLTRKFPNGFLRALTLIVAGASAALLTAVPGSSLAAVLAGIGIGLVAYELTFIPYSARLPQLTRDINRWSGYGWAAGYFGGLTVLGLALWWLIGEQALLKPWLATNDLNVRATAPLAALWVLALCLPLLRQPVQAPPTRELPLLASWRACAATPGLLRFIVASALYRDGLATVFGFGAIYAAAVHHFTLADTLTLGIVLNLGSGLGAALFARLDVPPMTTIRISLIGLLISGLCVLIAPDVPLFWAAACLLSLWFGPAQAAGRAYLLKYDANNSEAALALYTVTGRAANFIGPALYSLAVGLTGSQQAGMGTVLLLFVAAYGLLPQTRLQSQA